MRRQEQKVIFVMSTPTLYQQKYIYTQEPFNWRENRSLPVEFAILDPEPAIDWIEVKAQAQIRLDLWSRLLGYYTAQVKRQDEIIAHACYMQHEELSQKPNSVNQFLKVNQYE